MSVQKAVGVYEISERPYKIALYDK